MALLAGGRSIFTERPSGTSLSIDSVDNQAGPDDRKRESALGFVVRTFKHFHYIFEMAPFPVNQRRIPTSEELFGINR